MRLPDFKVEQWMNDYENDAIYNMTDTCVKSLTLQELLDLEDFDFSNLILDYGQITGDIELKKEILSLYEHGTIDNITTAQGCLQANELVMNTLLEKEMKSLVWFLDISSLWMFQNHLGVKCIWLNWTNGIGRLVWKSLEVF